MGFCYDQHPDFRETGYSNVTILTFLVKEMCSERVIYMGFIASCRAKNLVCEILKKGRDEAKKANGNQVYLHPCSSMLEGQVCRSPLISFSYSYLTAKLDCLVLSPPHLVFNVVYKWTII